MTENRWLRGKLWGNLPRAMLAVVRDSASERKLRLALCGLSRLSWPFSEEGAREATELAEKWADGEVAYKQVVAYDRSCHPDYPSVRWTVLDKPALNALEVCLNGSDRLVAPAIFREVFGNPFRPVTLDPSWLTSTVVALATGIYDERAFDRMPILADALQDAGCNNTAVLTHCRDTSLAHVRGCWVVDLLLNKG
jgi:hypothetical protein